MTLGIFFLPIYAEPSLEFGYQLLPEKLLENTDGILQLYVSLDDVILPVSIDNLRVISSDNEVIQITEIEQFNDYITHVKIQALTPGKTNLVIAASGFLSEELPIQVYDNNNFPTQIAMRVTPDVISIDGPRFGYFAIQILTTSGLPTITENDITVNISTPNNNVVELVDTELIIPKGSYYAVGKFNAKNSGDAIIFAKVDDMPRINKQIHISEPESPLSIALIVAPDTFNSFNPAKGYAIVQLQDTEGIPVNADKDIKVSLIVDNPDAEINVSHDFDEIIFDSKNLIIKKGTYSAITSFTPRPNLSDFTSATSQQFTISTSSSGYLTKTDTLTVIHQEIGSLQGNGPSQITTVPFLATGEKELVGVIYLEANLPEVAYTLQNEDIAFLQNVDVPVMANANLQLEVGSSHLSSLKPYPALFNRGDNAALLYGDTGTIIPDDDLQLFVTDNEGVKTVTTEPTGPLKDDLSLIIKPLVPMILTGKDFPVLAYLTEVEEESEEEATTTSEGEEEVVAEDVDPRLGVTPFIEEAIITFPTDEYVELEHQAVNQNQPYALFIGKSIKVGETEINAIGAGLKSKLKVTSYTTDPTQILIAYPEITLPDTNNIVTIQLLDSVGSPAYAKKDFRINLISNDELVIKLPSSVTIKKDDYHTFFEMSSGKDGSVEVSALAEDFPLAKFDFEVKGINPQITLTAATAIDIDQETLVRLSVVYPQVSVSPEGLEVEWLVTGGDIIQKETLTNENGVAAMTVLARDPNGLEIDAIVSGIGISNEKLTKTITVNTPTPIIPVSTPVEEPGFSFGTTNIIYIIIPVAIAAAIIFLKKTDRLEAITERLNVGDFNISDRVLEIKERVSSIRER